MNQTILGGNVMNMYLIFMLVNYGDIDADGYTYLDYYIIIFSSYPHTLQYDSSIDGKFVFFG